MGKSGAEFSCRYSCYLNQLMIYSSSIAVFIIILLCIGKTTVAQFFGDLSNIVKSVHFVNVFQSQRLKGFTKKSESFVTSEVCMRKDSHF